MKNESATPSSLQIITIIIANTICEEFIFPVITYSSFLTFLFIISLVLLERFFFLLGKTVLFCSSVRLSLEKSNKTTTKDWLSLLSLGKNEQRCKTETCYFQSFNHIKYTHIDV